MARGESSRYRGDLEFLMDHSFVTPADAGKRSYGSVHHSSKHTRPRKHHPHFLLMDEATQRAWHPLQSLTSVSVANVPRRALLCRDAIGDAAVSIDACVDFARAQANRFDYVLAECTEAFLWLCLFRLAGNQTPFAIVPRFNHVHASASYALLLASQMKGANDVLFAGSRAASRAFGMFGFRCSPLFVPGIDLNVYTRLSTPRCELRSGLGVHRDRDVLIYVGRMADDKNVMELLRAFAMIRQRRDAELVICYRFPRLAYAETCRTLAARSGGVRFVENPDRSTILQWYNASDLFVSAAVSVFETFGRAPVEAMACGTPPIVSAYDGFRDTVTPATGFLVPTASQCDRKWPDVPSFAAAILDALENKRQLRDMSFAGQRRARRFACRHALRGMLAELETPAGDEPTTGVARDGRVRLDGYPKAAAALWSEIEGERIRDLVFEFLATGKVPIRPPDHAVREYYTSWFATY